jgi:hypothetical protein
MKSIEYKRTQIHVSTAPPFDVRPGDYYVFLVNDSTSAVVFLSVDHGTLHNLSGASPAGSEEEALDLVRKQIDADEFERLASENEGRFVPEVVAYKVRKEVESGSHEIGGWGYKASFPVELICELHNALDPTSPHRAIVREALAQASKHEDNEHAIAAVHLTAEGNLAYDPGLAAAALSRRKANRRAKEVLDAVDKVSSQLQSALGNFVQAQQTARGITEGVVSLFPPGGSAQPIEALVANLQGVLGQFDQLNKVQGIFQLQDGLQRLQARGIPMPTDMAGGLGALQNLVGAAQEPPCQVGQSANVEAAGNASKK